MFCAPAFAAAPTITGVTAGTSDNGSSTANGGVTVTMPATIAADDLIVVLICSDGFNHTLAGSNGFALFSTEAATRPVAVWKKAVGNEDGSSISVGTTGASNAVVASVAFIVTGAADPAVTPPESSTRGDDAGASVSPDPPSLNSSFDGRDIRWVAWACPDDDPLTSAYPSSYSDNNTRYTYTTANAITNTFGSRAELVSDGTEDPGVFTVNASHFWSTRTLAFAAPASNYIPILTPPRRTQ